MSAAADRDEKAVAGEPTGELTEDGEPRFGSFSLGGTVYRVGEYVKLQAPEEEETDEETGKAKVRLPYYIGEIVDVFESTSDRLQEDDEEMEEDEDEEEKKDQTEAGQKEVMFTSRWFYRKQDVKDIANGFQGNEIFYSFHNDPNNAECVLEKCAVQLVWDDQETPIPLLPKDQAQLLEHRQFYCRFVYVQPSEDSTGSDVFVRLNTKKKFFPVDEFRSAFYKIQRRACPGERGKPKYVEEEGKVKVHKAKPVYAKPEETKPSKKRLSTTTTTTAVAARAISSPHLPSSASPVVKAPAARKPAEQPPTSKKKVVDDVKDETNTLVGVARSLAVDARQQSDALDEIVIPRKKEEPRDVPGLPPAPAHVLTRSQVAQAVESGSAVIGKLSNECVRVLAGRGRVSGRKVYRVAMVDAVLPSLYGPGTTVIVVCVGKANHKTVELHQLSEDSATQEELLLYRKDLARRLQQQTTS